MWDLSLRELFANGGPVMWPLLGVSVLGLALTLDRAVVFLRWYQSFDRLRQSLRPLVLQQNWSEAERLCRRPGPLTHLARVRGEDTPAMNLRFPAVLMVSAGIHGLLFWLVTAPPQPPVLLLSYGDMSVDVWAGSGLFPGDGRGMSINVAGRNPAGTHKESPSRAPPPPAQVTDRKPEPSTPASKSPSLPKPPLRVLTGQSEEGKSVPQTRIASRDKPGGKSEPIPKPAQNPDPPPPGDSSPLKKVPAPAAPASGPPGIGQPSGPPAGSGSPGGVPGGAGGPGGGTPGVRNGVRLLGNRMPAYPEEARLQGLEGRAVVWLRISAEGRVSEARVHQSSGHQVLDEAALQWAQSLRFLPARAGGAEVETTVLLPVRYRLVDTR